MNQQPEPTSRRALLWRRWPLILAGAALVGLTGAGAAASGPGPDTDEVEAEIDFTRMEGKFRICDANVAGERLEEGSGVLSGVSKGDPRLSGAVTLRLYRTADRLNADGHTGSATGRLEIVDPITRRMKVVAQVNLASRGGDLRGMAVGHVLDEGAGDSEAMTGSGQLSANMQIVVSGDGEPFDFRGRIGGVSLGDNLPAVIQRGGCAGPYESFGFDLPSDN